jgi:hypothetical protein
MTDRTFDDGDWVDEGEATVGWAIRAFNVDGEVKYDWIVDEVGGGYQESDEYYDSIAEAREGLGVE